MSKWLVFLLKQLKFSEPKDAILGKARKSLNSILIWYVSHPLNTVYKDHFIYI